jgi:hypothetical protein
LECQIDLFVFLCFEAHDLKGLTYYLMTGVSGLHFSLMTLIRYLGRSLIAVIYLHISLHLFQFFILYHISLFFLFTPLTVVLNR